MSALVSVPIKRIAVPNLGIAALGLLTVVLRMCRLSMMVLLMKSTLGNTICWGRHLAEVEILGIAEESLRDKMFNGGYVKSVLAEEVMTLV
jgi:hypothetical protein